MWIARDLSIKLFSKSPMNFFVVTLFALFLAVQASPFLVAPRANAEKLTVFVPKIISPVASTQWCIGQNATVLWDTSNAPQANDISNGAAILLHAPGKLYPGIALAKGFSLLTGSQGVSIPSNVTSGLYVVTLFGDSGDDSKPFSIVSCWPNVTKGLNLKDQILFIWTLRTTYYYYYYYPRFFTVLLFFFGQ